MPELSFQLLYPKGYKHSRIAERDRQFKIQNQTPYIFGTIFNLEERRSSQSVELMGVGQCKVRLTAVTNSSKILTIKNIGESPVLVLSENGLTTLNEIKTPNYSKTTLFFLGVDLQDDKVRSFKITFDSQDDYLLVTLE